MTRLRGRSLKGTRLVEHVPHGHWKTTTFLAGIRTSGWVAPLVIDGAINGRMFLAWVQQHLTKELRPGDIVVMDNLSSHKIKGVVEAIESVGASVQFIPHNSSRFQPDRDGLFKTETSHTLRQEQGRPKPVGHVWKSTPTIHRNLIP